MSFGSELVSQCFKDIIFSVQGQEVTWYGTVLIEYA